MSQFAVLLYALGMTEAVIYTRVSSREQQQEGFSLHAQSKLLRDYAQQNRLHIVQSFEDVETAKATGRKQFSQMVEFFRGSGSCRHLLVEKTDRITRNFRDAVTLEDLDIAVHLVKEGQVISKDSRSQAVLLYGFNLVLARHYSNNLREEVKKGMREKALLGVYPGHAPFGYRNNRADRTIEVDPIDSHTVNRIFALYATGSHTISTLVKTVEAETGKRMSRNNAYLILHNRFYVGSFEWGGEVYAGTHPLFVDPLLFERVQEVLGNHNRPKYSRREIAFRGLMRCAYDGCTVTGEIHKERYTYYRCSGYRGKCDLPRFREADIIDRLGEPLRGLQLGQGVISQIISALHVDRRGAAKRIKMRRSDLESRLTMIRDRMGKAYTDKLDGKISEEFWARRMNGWQLEEHRVKSTIERLDRLDVSDRIVKLKKNLDLANKAYSLYVSRDLNEKARLLNTLLLTCSIDARSIVPTYRRPFDMIFNRVGLEEWSHYLSSEFTDSY
jgi:site-specific DNA recombinase